MCPQKSVTFTDEQTENWKNQESKVLDGTLLQSKLNVPVSVRNAKGSI